MFLRGERPQAWIFSRKFYIHRIWTVHMLNKCVHQCLPFVESPNLTCLKITFAQENAATQRSSPHDQYQPMAGLTNFTRLLWGVVSSVAVGCCCSWRRLAPSPVGGADDEVFSSAVCSPASVWGPSASFSAFKTRKPVFRDSEGA